LKKKCYSDTDVLFINPRDLVAAVPYVKSVHHAAVLRDSDVRVEMIDPAASKISHHEILSIISKCSPRIICLSIFPSTLPDAFKTINLIKEKHPDIILVVEGYHINADPQILEYLNVDYGLTGDSEYTLRDLSLSILHQKEIITNMDGLVWRKEGSVVVNKAAVIQDINALPIPAYDLLPIGRYYSASTNKKIMYLFTTRGCPYDCSFCASAPQRNFRHLTIPNKIRYIDRLVNELQIEWLEFMDLTFTLSKKRTIEFCNAIVEAGLKFDWGCETRADLLDQEIITAMKLAGCKKITMGVEAGNIDIRYKTGKKITDAQFIEAFDLCRTNGIKTMANFILGHPGESVEQVWESIRFAKRLKPFNVFFIRMTPLPDVDIFKKGVINGEIDPEIWRKYMRGETGHPVYYTPTIGEKTLNKLYQKAFREFYFSWYAVKNYIPLFMNVRFFLKSIGIFHRVVFGAPLFK